MKLGKMKCYTGYNTEMNGVAVVNNTFENDFMIAGRFGVAAVRDTYNRAVKEWGKDIKYATALSLGLNHAGWAFYSDDNESEVAQELFKLWGEFDNYILDGEYDSATGEMNYKHFNREEIEYYVRATD